MEIDEKKLKELIVKAIEIFQSEVSSQNIICSKKKIYVILTEEFNNKYESFFESLNQRNEYEAYAIVPSEMYNYDLISKLKRFKVCKEVISRDNIDFNEISNFITVFPIISRSAVVKTALCIEDIFETKWIFNCIEKGEKIILLQSGLKKFSGNEPSSYINKILNYYRSLLEFNIQIVEDIDSLENSNNNFESKESFNYINSFKKIITESEVELYENDKQILLNNGDIITDMAKDKARKMNIEIIRKL